MNSLDKLVDNFELLGDWDQRYSYIMELGDKLPVMPQQLMLESNKVQGCMSSVFVSAYRATQNPQLIRFHGYCDTDIIRGVLAILIQLTEGKTRLEIDQLDVDELFTRLNLHKHLSPNRHVGIYAIVVLMKQQAHNLESKPREVA